MDENSKRLKNGLFTALCAATVGTAMYAGYEALPKRSILNSAERIVPCAEYAPDNTYSIEKRNDEILKITITAIKEQNIQSSSEITTKKLEDIIQVVNTRVEKLPEVRMRYVMVSPKEYTSQSSQYFNSSDRSPASVEIDAEDHCSPGRRERLEKDLAKAKENMLEANKDCDKKMATMGLQIAGSALSKYIKIVAAKNAVGEIPPLNSISKGKDVMNYSVNGISLIQSCINASKANGEYNLLADMNNSPSCGESTISPSREPQSEKRVNHEHSVNEINFDKFNLGVNTTFTFSNKSETMNHEEREKAIANLMPQMAKSPSAAPTPAPAQATPKNTSQREDGGKSASEREYERNMETDSRYKEWSK